MESLAHVTLKRMAIGFLRGLGCQAVATEVRCPIPRYRVDVAGYLDRGPGAAQHAPACTVMIECKQDRGDFLRDRQETDRLLALRADLERLRAQVEERRIKRLEPHLRQEGSSLFPELDAWDFASSRLCGYRRLVARIADVDRRLYGRTKFFTIGRYRLADRLYLAVPQGLIRPRELPRGWGLLECPRRGGPELRIAVEAPAGSSSVRHRKRLLRDISVSASRQGEGSP